MRKWIIYGMVFIPVVINAQGLFESAGQDESPMQAFELNGYTRGVLYIGEYNAPAGSEIRSGYGEAALKLSASSGNRAKLYSDIRFRSGFEYNEWVNEINLREAYADLYLGDFELRAGQQIIAWGRADGINPTNNLTPQNYFVRSPDPDDMRMGNFLVRGRYNIHDKIRLEGIWVPRYRYSIYRFDLFETPSYVNFLNSEYPEAALVNGSFAARIEFLFNRFDGSISWFSGYDPLPGIEAADLPDMPSENLEINMLARASKQQTLGLDFSSGMGSFGVRGEAAFRMPQADYEGQIFTPAKDLRYVLGVDRAFGNFNFIAMYVGQYVFDFKELPIEGGIPEIDPLQLQNPEAWSMIGPMMDEQLKGFNRIIFNQTKEISHSVAVRPSLSLFHDVAEVEIFGLYNFSTDEWTINPKIGWRISDELKLSVGGQYFEGPANTMYNMVGPVFNGGFFELRYTF